MKDKTRLNSSELNINGNSIYVLDNVKYVYDVWDTEGNSLKTDFNIKTKTLTILGKPVDAIYVHFENNL